MTNQSPWNAVDTVKMGYRSVRIQSLLANLNDAEHEVAAAADADDNGANASMMAMVMPD